MCTSHPIEKDPLFCAYPVVYVTLTAKPIGRWLQKLYFLSVNPYVRPYVK